MDIQTAYREVLKHCTPEETLEVNGRLGDADRNKEREDCESSLLLFLERAWPYIDPSEFQTSWCLEAIADHLECVASGQIKRLLINCPPRAGKTNMVSVAFPAWVWCQSRKDYLSGPQVRFFCASHSHSLSLDASNKSRRLMMSPWFQTLWPSRIELRLDQNAKQNYENTMGGARIATSVGTSIIGSGGDLLLCDDPNKVDQAVMVESEAEREQAANFWQEFHTTRLNDPQRSALVCVQQRLHERDVSGIILESGEDWTHLCIPMLADFSRSYVTVKLPQYGEDDEPWDDPRTEDGELMWPERFPAHVVSAYERELGRYLFAGRYQQLPVPKGGGIIQADWWQLWDDTVARTYGLEWTPGDKDKGPKDFPPCELVVGSIDTAYGEKQENDYSAMTVWGVWIDRNKNRRAMLMYSWAARLALHGKPIEVIPGEPDEVYLARRLKAFGLVERIADTCRRYGVRRLLIENKTRGQDVANEIRRLYTRDNWGVELVNPVKDKVSRTHSVVPMFTDGAIWAPNTVWAQSVLDQCGSFPKGRNDDLHDTVTMFLNWARENEALVRADEMSAMITDELTYRPPVRGVAEHYGL